MKVEDSVLGFLPGQGCPQKRWAKYRVSLPVDSFGHVHERDVVCAHAQMKDCAMVLFVCICVCL